MKVILQARELSYYPLFLRLTLRIRLRKFKASSEYKIQKSAAKAALFCYKK